MMYIKDGDKIYRVITTRTEVDLEALKQRLANLEAIEKPTDEELIEVGKEFHEYYEDRETRIALLKAQIAEIEKAIFKRDRVTTGGLTVEMLRMRELG